MSNLEEKNKKLRDYILELGSVAIAFSAGVDSTFLLKTAHDLLGDRAIAVTVRSQVFTKREMNEAAEFCKKEGIEHIIYDFDVFSVNGFSENPKNRCYICKKELFTNICKTAAERNIKYVAEGSNIDDDGDYRPGHIAIKELGIKSPLRHASLTKKDIRALSEKMGLPTWDKPSFACLATRFPYGEAITKEKLDTVEKAEQQLLNLGFKQMRVRIHGNVARIEILPDDFPKILNIANEINAYFQSLGFTYVTLDLGGYKTGNMNKTLNGENYA